MTILQHSIAQAAAAATSYQIARSLRFNSADSAYLNRTFGSVGNRSVWTWSGWIKRSKISAVQRLFCGGNGGLLFQANDTFLIDYDGGTNYASTTAVYRDVGAHCHVHVVLDTTQATATNRIKFWLNGVQQTLSFTGTIPLNGTGVVNNSVIHYIGTLNASSQYCDLMAADIRFIDGQSLDPTSFGQFDSATGVWVPIAYTGTYGTNGFWLKLDDNSNTTAATLGKDSSGNGNNWTPNNFSVTAGVGNDSLVDSPTWYGTDTGAGGEVRGNYCTLNPIAAITSNTSTNGNLDTSVASASSVRGTFPLVSGKWYWEVIPTSTANNAQIGICSATNVDATPQITSTGWCYNQPTGNKFNDPTGSAYGATYAQNDVIGIALDMDTGKIWWSKNGVWQASGNPATGANAAFTNVTGTVVPVIATTGSGVTGTFSANFGQRPFAYTAPSGFKALCTTNLPTPAIALANQHFEADAYTGTGTTLNRTLSFKPDFLWFKIRSAAANHVLIDSVRGTNPFLISNATTAEQTATDQLLSFNSNGYTLGANTTGGNVNVNGSTYIGWAWKGGGAAVTNNAGTISSQVSANPTAGFSIVAWTSTGSDGTVGHGLGAVPAFIIARRRNTIENWPTYHKNMGGNNGYMLLNAPNAFATNAAPYNSTNPTASVFSVSNNGMGAGTGNPMIAYCFAEVAGFSKFGNFIGNGSADGTFVYCGFRPRWILYKPSNRSATDWVLWDTARQPYNVAGNYLLPNLNAAEGNAVVLDILSNGFKMRVASTGNNGSGDDILFAAFAESPFNYSRAR